MVSPSELRRSIAAEVGARVPVDEREAAAIPEFLHHLARLDDPFSETADPVHVTGSAIVVGGRGVVLHRHKRLGLWLQPGGHIDPGELPWDAAYREAIEETGLAVVHPSGVPHLVHVDVHAGPRGHTHLDLRYLLIAGDADPDPGEGESRAIGWFDWEDARRLTDPGLAGALAALQPSSLDRVELRPAVAADAPWLGHLYLRSTRAALVGLPVVHTDDETMRWLADELLPTRDVWVAVVAGAVAGFVALADGLVDQLYLDPPWIGRGIGRRLLDHAKTSRPDGLELWTYLANERARRFYAREGFVEAERTDGSGNELRSPDVRLAWPGVTTGGAAPRRGSGGR